jgi:hypothetical protein
MASGVMFGLGSVVLRQPRNPRSCGHDARSGQVHDQEMHRLPITRLMNGPLRTVL